MILPIVYALTGTATLVVGVMSGLGYVETTDKISGRKLVVVMGLLATGTGLLWMAGR